MATTEFNFEKALKELEDITAWFESGDANLDQGLQKFERGMELAGQLKSHIDSVENRVEKIKHKFAPAAGSPAAAPEADAASDPTPDPAAADIVVSDNQAGLF